MANGEAMPQYDLYPILNPMQVLNCGLIVTGKQPKRFPGGLKSPPPIAAVLPNIQGAFTTLRTPMQHQKHCYMGSYLQAM